MKKIQILKTLASAVLCAAFSFGCQAQENCSGNSCTGNSGTPKCPSGKAAAPNGAVKQAVTPQGEMIYIFAVWDAEAVPKNTKDKCCKAAQCWQTRDGKVWCAKPLVKAPVKGNLHSGKVHMQTKDKKLFTVDNNCKNVLNNSPKNWAVKQVKKCPYNGSKKCPASEHVKMKDGSWGCAAKADLKAQKNQENNGGIPVLEDEIVEEDSFIVTSN